MIAAAMMMCLMRLDFIGSKVFERQADIGELRQTGLGTNRMGLLQELLDLLQVTGFCCAFRLNQDLPNGLLFFHGFRLGERGERVKEKSKYFLKGAKRCGFIGENALVVSLSSARLSGRKAVCTLPTDEADR
jgi:hypothetical protein